MVSAIAVNQVYDGSTTESPEPSAFPPLHCKSFIQTTVKDLVKFWFKPPLPLHSLLPGVLHLGMESKLGEHFLSLLSLHKDFTLSGNETVRGSAEFRVFSRFLGHP